MSNYNNLIKKGNYIANEWQYNGNGESLTVIDKYSSKELATIPLATENQMETAIASAVDGFNTFKKWSAGERSAILTKLRNLIEEHQDELAQLIVDEAGKPLSYSKR